MGSTRPLIAADARIATTHRFRVARAGGVLELEVALFVAFRIVADVGRVDEELDLRGRERGSELGG